MILSIVLAVVFYALIIFGVGYVRVRPILRVLCPEAVW